MWKIRPNFAHLYSPIMSLVKYSTNYVNREKFNDILHGCGKIDLISTSCDILDRKRHMWKMRPNFSHLYSPKMCHLFDIWPNIAQVSNSIELFAAVKNFHRIRYSHDIFDRIHHMWKIRPNFSHLYSPKISHVKYPTKYIKREEFDRILHRCEQLDLIRHSYDIFDRIHQMWKIRPNFSHLYSPIRPRVRCLTDYIKREKFNDILHRCGKIDRIHTSCDILDRKHHMWKIRPNFSHLHLPKIANVKFRLNMSNMRNMIEYFTDVNNLTKVVKVITYSAEYITCEKSDRISHTYIWPKCVTCKKFDRICHLWGIRSNTLLLWNYGKKDLIRHTIVTHLTENITYEKYVPVSHTYIIPQCHM